MHKWEREKRSENRKNVSICCRGGACPSRRYTADSHRPPSKRRWPPTGPVAVFPERPVGDIQPQKCSGAPLHRPDVSLRGGRRPTWQSREGTHDFADRFPTIQSGAARLHPKGTSSRFALRAPRRFAPRNDKSEAITILTAAGTDWKCAARPGCPLPCGGLVKLSAFRFQVSTCRSPAFYFLCFANRNAPMRADRGTARITPTELAMACTISTEKNVPLMSWENDGSSDER